VCSEWLTLASIARASSFLMRACQLKSAHEDGRESYGYVLSVCKSRLTLNCRRNSDLAARLNEPDRARGLAAM
jgi:hypothetical protein